jgi:hypothetical protein
MGSSMKVCGSCKVEKPLSDFNKSKAKKFGVSSKCRDCSIAYHKQYYSNEENRQAAIARASRVRKTSGRKLREERYLLVEEYLKTHPCVDCGETEIILLDFDHQRDKEIEVSKLKMYSSTATLLEEIAKCEVRCVRCHRRKTAEQLGWYKGLV